jgi:5,10-methylenetetrahydromethanopterin reductase
VNGWDEQVVLDVRSHPIFTGLGKVADMAMQRHQMMDAAALIPDEWMLDSCAYGTAEECATNLRRFADAGANEIATYGSTPTQNAGLVTAWKEMVMA